MEASQSFCKKKEIILEPSIETIGVQQQTSLKQGQKRQKREFYQSIDQTNQPIQTQPIKHSQPIKPTTSSPLKFRNFRFSKLLLKSTVFSGAECRVVCSYDRGAFSPVINPLKTVEGLAASQFFWGDVEKVHSLKLTQPLKNGGWKMNFL